MPITPLTGGSITGMKSLYTAGAATPEDEPGFLLSLALTLDAPRNFLWGGTSEKRVTGWDALRKVGIKDKPGEFDPVDVLAFALEVAGDPLTYVGGLGGLTKVGSMKRSLKVARGSKQAGVMGMKAALESMEKFNTLHIGKALKEMEKGGNLKKIIKGLDLGVDEAGEAIVLSARQQGRFKKAVESLQRAKHAGNKAGSLKRKLKEMGASYELEDLWSAGAKADLPERKLLSAKIPFTDIEKVLIKGAPVLAALQATGRYTKKVPPIAAMGRLLSAAFQRSDVLKPWMHEYQTQTRLIMQEAVEEGEELGGRIVKLHADEAAARLESGEIKALGDYTEDMFFTDIINARESLGVTPKIRDAQKKVREDLLVKVEQTRSRKRKLFAKEYLRQLKGERKRNQIDVAKFETEAKTLERMPVKSKSELRILERIKELETRMTMEIDGISVRAEGKMNSAADELARLRGEFDELEFQRVRSQVSRESLQKELDEFAPGWKVDIDKNGKFKGLKEFGKKKRESLKALAEREGLESVEKLEEFIGKTVDDLRSLGKNEKKFGSAADSKLTELNKQFDFIDKQLDGTWKWDKGPMRGGVTGTSTFAGYDTLGSGFSASLGFKFTHHVEINPRTVKLLSEKLRGEPVAIRSVRDTDEIIKKVREGTDGTAGKPGDPNHLFHASPECQRCSTGSREIELDDGDYLNAQAVVKILKDGKAPVVTIENVENYATFVYTGKLLGKRRKTPYSPFDEIIKTLDNQGYAVDFHIVDAADFGAATERNRLFIRAVKKNTLKPEFRDIKLDRVTGISGLTKQHPIEHLKVAKQTDWYTTLTAGGVLPKGWQTMNKANLLGHGIVDDTAKYLGSANVEVRDLKAKIASEGSVINADSPILIAGGSQQGTVNARNVGRPGPVVTKSSQVMRIVLPKGGSLDPKLGARAYRVNGRMLSRLMGMPDDMILPVGKKTPGRARIIEETNLAKDMLGNGIHGNHTKAVIESLIEGRIAGGIAAKANKTQSFKFAGAKSRATAELLKQRFRLRDARDATTKRIALLRGNADKLKQGIKDDNVLAKTADERAENLIPKVDNIKGDPLDLEAQLAPKGVTTEGGLGRASTKRRKGLPESKIRGPLVKSITKIFKDKGKMLDDLDKNVADSEAAMSLLTPNSRALVQHLDQETGELLARRVAVGATKEGTVLAARLQSITKNYAERVLTGEAREWLLARRATDGGGGTMLDQYHRSMGRYAKKTMSAKTGGDIPRLDRFREEFTSEVNDFFEKLPGDRPAQWFEKDFSVTFPGKYIGDERSVLNASFIKSMRTAKGVVGKITDDNIHDMVSLADFFMEHGIHRIRHKGKIVVLGDSQAAQKAMDAAGLFDSGIPNALADEIRGVTSRLVDSDDLSHLGKIYDKFLGVTRWSLTRPWVPFHMRNFMTNISLNWMGGVSKPRYYKMAVKALRDPEEVKRLEALGVFTGGWSKEITKELTEGGGAWKRMENWFKVKLPKGSKAWKMYTRAAEDIGRAAHFYGKKAGGLTDFEALESVNKYLLDYSDLTKFERRYGKRMFMFYNWTRKMVPMLLAEYVHNPSKMALLTRGSVQPSLMRPDGLPEYIKASFALPLPWKDKQGRQQFVTTFGSPIEELRKFDITQREGGLAGIGSELVRTIIGQMTPPFKQAAEIAAGKDFFYRKPIQEADRVKQMFGLEKLLPGLRTDVLKSGKTRLRADPDALYALRQSPLSRLVSTLQKLGDPDRNLADKLFATLSGINVARYYKETQAPRAAVENLQKLLRRQIPEGEVRKLETVYPTEAGKRNPDTMRLMDALRAAEKKSRAVYQHSGGKL